MFDKTVLLTGATGFVGKALACGLKTKELRLLSRSDPLLPQGIFCKADVGRTTDYSSYLQNVDVVIHAAARVHVMDESCNDPLRAFREVNTAGTANLARQAAALGVKRFIFVSSIKVNGEGTTNKQPYYYDDIPAPEDAYGLSKKEAEEALWQICNETGMELVIIRPPLIYGPGVKANFASLLNLVSKGFPLPFACFTKNKRSMVSLDNLVSLIITCIEHPNAANQVFLVSDGHDLSTAEMISKLSNACGKSSFMLPIPILFFNMVAKLLGKQAVIERLTGSLYVDISKTKKLLNWTPPQIIDDGFKQTADAFLESKNK